MLQAIVQEAMSAESCVLNGLGKHETENEACSEFYSNSLVIITHMVSVNCFCLCVYGHRLKNEADSHCSIEEEEEEGGGGG